MKQILLPIIFIVSTISTVEQAKAQSSAKLHLTFQPTWVNQTFELNQPLFIPSKKDSIEINTLKFYISHVVLYHQKKVVWQEHNSAHLLDAEKSNTLELDLSYSNPKNKILAIDAIGFSIGIDSVTNVSGALGGDLDPMKGMYWTWQSGYINAKIEGTSKECNTRNHSFQYHLGGYLSPNNTLQNVLLTVPSVQMPNYKIAINLDAFLKNVDFKTQPLIMTPGKDAVELSKLFSSSFSLSTK